MYILLLIKLLYLNEKIVIKKFEKKSMLLRKMLPDILVFNS